MPLATKTSSSPILKFSKRPRRGAPTWRNLIHYLRAITSACDGHPHTGGSRRCRRSTSLQRDKCSDESKSSELSKTPRIEQLVEMVQKRIHEYIQQSRDNQGSSALRISDSPLSEEILSHRFLMKLVIPNFECYTRATYQ